MKRDRITTPIEPPPREPPPEPVFELPKLMAVTAEDLERWDWVLRAGLIFPSSGVLLSVHNAALDDSLASIFSRPIPRKLKNEQAAQVIRERRERIQESQEQARKACGMHLWPLAMNLFERTKQKERCEQLIASGEYPVQRHELSWPKLSAARPTLLSSDDPREAWLSRAAGTWARHTATLLVERKRALLIRVGQLDEGLSRASG